ncbi:hypothetical protein [Kitasatospora setae]|uniref:hypothetical protein n=1 Tax=Kitasatospora setae TaxID=2066 RepID=UPI0006908D0F|nr:hypothetical protein [Kitasatospora setae]
MLQDDVTPEPGFAAQLAHVLAARPDHAVALYVNWNTPYNSYLARRAAASGAPFAPLHPREWVPALGLALPAPAARDLARHLARYPDELKDDDELIAEFCAAAGLPVLAAVPHLLEHGEGPSLADNSAHGARHAAVPMNGRRPGPAHWRRPDPPRRHRPGTARAYAVELVRSRCVIRIARPGEPVGHPYTWPWADWAQLVGADPGELRAALDGTVPPAGVPADTAREVWAAGWLLGFDAAPLTGSPGPTRAALRSWLCAGLDEPDLRSLDEPLLDALTTFAEHALESGAKAAPPAPAADAPPPDASPSPHLEPPTRPRPPGTAADPLARLARREAELLTAVAVDRSPALAVRGLPCPHCPAGPADLARSLARLPMERLRLLGPGEDPGPDEAELALLHCELPDTRPLLPLLTRTWPDGPPRLVSRAAGPHPGRPSALDRAEADPHPAAPVPLPATLRRLHDCPRPDLADDPRYRELRTAAVRSLL